MSAHNICLTTSFLSHTSFFTLQIQSVGCICHFHVQNKFEVQFFCHYPEASRCNMIKNWVQLLNPLFSICARVLSWVPIVLLLVTSTTSLLRLLHPDHVMLPCFLFSCHASFLLLLLLLLLPSSSLPVSNASQTIPEVFRVWWSYL